MGFEDYMKYSCNLFEISQYANEKGILENYYGQLKGNYRKFFEDISNVKEVKYAIRMYRAQKEMMASAQMLFEAKQNKKNGCVIGYFFLCYYALFHAMQANLFLNINISDEEILPLSHVRVESYFADFYCKGKKSIMPQEIIEMFQELKGFREVYSYSMPFNNPNNLNVDVEKLEYFIKLCFQHCNLISLIVNQLNNSVHWERVHINELENYFSECCYKEDYVTGKLIKDISDEIFWNEIKRNFGMDIMPFSVIADHHFDEYGGYDSRDLEKMGFKNVATIRHEAFSFYYNSIVLRG